MAMRLSWDQVSLGFNGGQLHDAKTGNQLGENVEIRKESSCLAISCNGQDKPLVLANTDRVTKGEDGSAEFILAGRAYELRPPSFDIMGLTGI